MRARLQVNITVEASTIHPTLPYSFSTCTVSTIFLTEAFAKHILRHIR